MNYLLRKGIGILRINVFVARTTTTLNLIDISEDFCFRAIDDHVLDDILVIRGKKKYNQLKENRNKGAYGISLYKANALAAYGWIGVNRAKSDIRIFTSFAIPQNCAHIFDCYTIEKFRGQKLYPAIVYNLVNWGRLQQVENVYIDTVVENVSASKGIAELGFDYISLQTKLLFFSKLIFEYDRKR
jgi:hypothetical protein